MCMDNMKLWYLSKRRAARAKGVPPLTFTSDGAPLVDYTIHGAAGGVGERTVNLFDKSQTIDTDYYFNNSGNLVKGAFGDGFLAIAIPVEANTQYTFSWVENILGSEDNTAYIRISFFTSNSKFTKRLVCNCAQESQNAYSFLTEYATEYLDIRIDSETSERGQHLIGVCMVKGETAPEQYIPYGYKIPVTCGGETTNIYIGDTPLGTGQTVTGAQTGVAIPTVSGTNVLTVGTAVQPTCVSVSAEPDMPTPLERYLYSRFIINDE